MLLQLTKDDTNYLKAIAIIVIVLHNYLHFIPPHFGENEMYFSAKVIWGVIQKVGNDFTLLPKLILSSFGHFGVQTFIFLSGYGLAKSFASYASAADITENPTAPPQAKMTSVPSAYQEVARVCTSGVASNPPV